MAMQPGQTIGRYQILSQLGVGGMATVYKAYQPSLDRTVALKVMRAGLAEDTEFRERFQREARAIARLVHPNIVQVFDFDEVDGRSFMTMQYMEGGTLKDKIAELAKTGERLPPREAVRIVREVGDALAYAHGLGIVHRDVKPSNVMLTNDGKAVVTDFGIAKILSGAQYTQAGVGIGTPEYMSPEQGQGKTVDARSDLYSLAVMAYELLVGKVPFSADAPLAVVLSHVRDPIPLPSMVNPSIGQATERVLLKALAKEPSERYASTSEFAAVLGRAVTEGEGGTAKTLFVSDAASVQQTVVSRGAAPAAPAAPAVPVVAAASSAVAAGGLFANRLVPIGAAIAVLLIAGGAVAVSGVFRGAPVATVAPTAAQPTSTGAPTVAPSVASTAAQPAQPTSTGAATALPSTAVSAPAAALPPRGALAYELDLKNPQSGPVVINLGNPSADKVTPIAEGLQVDVSAGSNVNIQIRMPMQDVVVEGTVRYVSGPDSGAASYQYNVRTGPSGADFVVVDPPSGNVTILRFSGSPPPQPLTQPKQAGFGGVGKDQTVAVSAIGGDIVVYTAGAELVRAKDPAPTQGGVTFGANGRQGRLVVVITALRVYRAP